MKNPDACVLVFAKAPVPGKVNTRLIPDLGIEESTLLHITLTRRRLEQLSNAHLCDVILYCAPDRQHEFFNQCASDFALSLKDQTGSCLGERMANALHDEIKNYTKVIIVGTDAPSLNRLHVEQAISSLDENDLVIVPAEDGGYVLIGAKHDCPGVFESVDWGESTVLKKTLSNAESLGLKVSMLNALWDVDTIEDYRRYQRWFESEMV